MNRPFSSKRRLSYSVKRVLCRARRYSKAVKASDSWQSLLKSKLLDFWQTLRHPKPHRRQGVLSSPSSRIFISVLAVVIFTSAIGFRFYNEPRLSVGTIAPQTLRASASVRVEDIQTTQTSRESARTGATPVLKIDQTRNQEIYQSLTRLLDEGNELRQQAGSFPFVNTSFLSTSTQAYLRATTEQAWKAAIAGYAKQATGEKYLIRPQLG